MSSGTSSSGFGAIAQNTNSGFASFASTPGTPNQDANAASSVFGSAT